MGKVKFQGGITKAVTSMIAKRNKNKFSNNLKNITDIIKNNMTNVDVDFTLVSFSSSKDFYDQILSICSFLRYVGNPDSWVIYSDGSHTEKEIEFLEAQFVFLKIVKTQWTNTVSLTEICKKELLPYKSQLFDYAIKHPLGKKLFHYLNHNINKPTLFIDSDILFYTRASILNNILNEDIPGWYLPDIDSQCLDKRFRKSSLTELYNVNSGFILLKQNLSSLIAGLEFLKSLNYEYEYFTEQTVQHILLKSNGLMPLDPRLFILNSDDQFDFSYLFSRNKVAVRHYTGPVRHKMWQRGWKWHLSIK